jgi:hypothetical protein
MAEPPPSPLTLSIEEAVSAVGRALRREMRRTLIGLVLGLLTGVLLLVVSLGFAVAGILRLGDALARLCGHWFGNQELADVVVGLTLLALPLAGVLLLRLRRW